MGLFGGLFGGSGDHQASTSTTTSTTLTNTGSGLAASGVTGNVNFTSNDPATAVAALEANAFTVDRSLGTVDKAVKGNNDLATNTISTALKTVADTVTQANGILERSGSMYTNALLDNRGVAPVTLQQQQQAASSDLIKVGLFGALVLAAIVLLSRNDVAKTVLKSSK